MIVLLIMMIRFLFMKLVPWGNEISFALSFVFCSLTHLDPITKIHNGSGTHRFTANKCALQIRLELMAFLLLFFFLINLFV